MIVGTYPLAPTSSMMLARAKAKAALEEKELNNSVDDQKKEDKK